MDKEIHNEKLAINSFSVNDGDTVEKQKGVEDKLDADLPPILLPENQYALQMIAPRLDTRSFARLASTNSRLYSSAKNAYLTVPFKLRTHVRRIDEVPVFESDYGQLNSSMMTNLSKAYWLRPEISSIVLWALDYSGGFHLHFDDHLERIIQWGGIRYIDTVNVTYGLTDFRFLKTCKVRKLAAHFLKWLSFLDFPNIFKTEDFYLELCPSDEKTEKDGGPLGFRNYDSPEEFRRAREDKRRLMEFIEKSSARTFHVEYLECPPSFFIKIMEMWQAGLKDFKRMELEGGIPDGSDYVGEFLKGREVVHSDQNLQLMEREDVVKMLGEMKPMVIVGVDEYLVIIRDDLQMLRVGFETYSLYCDAYMTVI